MSLTKDRCYIHRRYVALFLACLVVFAADLTLKNLTVTFTSGQLLDPVHGQRVIKHPPACQKRPPLKNHTTNSKLYKWDWFVQQYIYQTLQWGTVMSHLPAGIVADKYGCRYVILTSLIMAACLTLVAPAILKNCQGYWKVMIGYNILRGLSRGMVEPALASYLGQWFPPSERTLASSFLVSVWLLGGLLNIVVGNALLQAVGTWSVIFYVLGSVQLLCGILWFFLGFSSPEDHPRISLREKHFLRKKLGSFIPYKEKTIPWSEILTSLPIWALLVSRFGLSLAALSITERIIDFVEVGLGYKISATNYSIIMCLIMVFNLIWGYLVDHLTTGRGFNIATARKIAASFGSMGAGIFCLTTVYMKCSRDLVLGIITVAMCVVAIFFTAAYANALDLGSNFAGVITGLGKTIFTSVKIGFIVWWLDLTVDNSKYNWALAFWMILGMSSISNIIFVLFCKGTERRWNRPKHVRRKYTRGFGYQEDDAGDVLEMK